MVVGPDLIALLDDLHRVSGGSLALVSGRSIAALDRLFAPFRAVAVGLHGIEVRRAPDAPSERQVCASAPIALREAVRARAVEHGAGLVEDKGAAIAVHHRLDAPRMQALRGALRQACTQHAPDWTVLRGRRVLELKPRAATKARGVDALMSVPPFRDTVPIAFGDDTTDLDMFEAIRRHRGTAISVGPRIADRADLRLTTPRDSIEILSAVRDALARGADARRIDRLLKRRARDG